MYNPISFSRLSSWELNFDIRLEKEKESLWRSSKALFDVDFFLLDKSTNVSK